MSTQHGHGYLQVTLKSDYPVPFDLQTLLCITKITFIPFQVCDTSKCGLTLCTAPNFFVKVSGK